MKAMIAMSGGVDSSIAAACMQELGYECTGVNMKLLDDNAYPQLAQTKGCCSLEDSEDARGVCASLKMPFYVFDYTREFRARVIEGFIQDYANGITPNPCIVCNRVLKFNQLLQRAKVTGFDCLVTGHYARIFFDENNNRWRLAKGIDATKDQSYVLYAMTQEQLALTKLPLGNLTKQEVRERAKRLELPTAEKPESQDICFVPEGDYAAFITKTCPDLAKPGKIVSENGIVLGEHKGIINYTIGQRRGIGVAASKPYYVKRIDPLNNAIIIAYAEQLLCTKVTINDINIIEPLDQSELTSESKSITLKAMYRYRGNLCDASVRQTGSDELEVTFACPQKFVTPGQALVLYNNDFVFGGGTIIAVDSL